MECSSALPPQAPPWGPALTELELQALLQLVYLLRELAQHGAQEGDLLVLLRQSHMKLVEAVICLLQELLQALEAARLQVCLVSVLVPDKRAPEGQERQVHCTAVLVCVCVGGVCGCPIWPPDKAEPFGLAASSAPSTGS